MFTSHGHHILGTALEEERPNKVARCGGPGVCATCSKEAGEARFKIASSLPMVPASPPPTIHQIPSAPLSDEDLRIECLKMAVELKARFTQTLRSEATIEVAKEFFEYIRPSK